MTDKEAIEFSVLVLSDSNDEELLELIYGYLDTMAERAMKGDKEIGNTLIRHYFMMVPYLDKLPKCTKAFELYSAQMFEEMPVQPLYEK